MKKMGLVLLALTLAALLIGPRPSAAEGALAVGATGNIFRDGIAMGHTINAPTRDDAVSEALKVCRNNGKSETAAEAACKIVGTFSRQCYATSYDPKAGTPGTGWAIAATLEKAKSQALAKCRATAGASRRKFCEIAGAECDMHD